MHDQEYYDILHDLQDCHALFAEFWVIGRFETVEDNESLKTVTIRFDQDGNGLVILVNKDFWASLSVNEKSFVLAHEFYHSYLAHGIRFKTFKDHARVNIAGDLVINHSLVDGFGFDRDQLKFSILDKDGINGVDRLCWLDTMFDHNKHVMPHKTTEYYYEQLPDNADGLDYILIGGHGIGDCHSDPQAQAARNFIERITARMSNDEIDDFNNRVAKHNSGELSAAQQAGSMASESVKIIQLSKVVKKRKWEEVIGETLGRFKGSEQKIYLDNWTRRNRRFVSIGDDLMLPTQIPIDVRIRDRIDVWWFMDTSGSCVKFSERFFKAAASIPEDRFECRGFCFDTRVYEVDMKKGELRGFGGTMFNVIEDHIQQVIKREPGTRYPQFVFLITDGHGNDVNPEYPDRWHWFLTPSNSTRYIPQKSKKYYLSDYE